MKQITHPGQFLARHLLDDQLPHAHKITFGFIVGMAGVTISHFTHAITFLHLNLLLDWFGYFLHGAGIVPFLNAMLPSKQISKPITTTQTTKK